MNDSIKHVRRSKIYSYFYGKNTVFQQFLLVAGVLFLMMVSIGAVANQKGYAKKLDRLYEAYQDAERDYDDVRYSDDMSDPDWQAKKETAERKYEKARDKYIDYRAKNPSDNFLSGLSRVIGILSIVTGLVWFIIRKLSFNRDGEREVDEELLDIVDEAKKKGLEKLNIISDQIERVEPVVLHGVARTEETSVSLSQGHIAKLLSALGRFILRFDKLIVGLIVAFLFARLASLIAVNMFLFVLMFLVALAGVGAAGYFLYKKFEMESHVSERVIKRLTKFTPNFIAKLGSDERVRVSLPAITVYMFGDDQLYMYYQYIDIVTGRIFCEGVHEYFYEDIVGITSSQETKKIYKRCGFMKLFLKSIDYLKENITVFTSGCSHRESYIVDVDKSLLDTQFIGMRNLIRQKKAEK